MTSALVMARLFSPTPGKDRVLLTEFAEDYTATFMLRPTAQFGYQSRNAADHKAVYSAPTPV